MWDEDNLMGKQNQLYFLLGTNRTEWLKKPLNNVGGLLGQHYQLKPIGISKLEK